VRWSIKRKYFLVIKNPHNNVLRGRESEEGERWGRRKNVVFIIVVSKVDTDFPNCPLYPRICSIAQVII